MLTPFLELITINYIIPFMNWSYKRTNKKQFIMIQVIRNGDISSYPNLMEFTKENKASYDNVSDNSETNEKDETYFVVSDE
jgi:hypothetical protein